MVFYDGYDISSDGPGSFEIYNENDCAAKCIETIGCKGFTMVGLEPYRGCHLKSSFGFKHNMLYYTYIIINGFKSMKNRLISKILYLKSI